MKKKTSQSYLDHSTLGQIQDALSTLNEAEPIYSTRLRPIGNSNGLIIQNQLLQSAGLNPDQRIKIVPGKGVLFIVSDDETGVNTDLSSWDKQFRKAIQLGHKPDSDLFEGMQNDFDQNEW